MRHTAEVPRLRRQLPWIAIERPIAYAASRCSTASTSPGMVGTMALLSMAAIAERQNDEGVPTAKGGTWYASTVKRVLERVGSDKQ